ncbi:MAG: glycosyltransferase family 4 protein [Olsenella sp.]|nr:glycosyltransferase family 4 protein [Olsenella sp.]
MIYIDTRWVGEHGIGRYAREVTGRLDVEWESLGLDGSPSSPTGCLEGDLPTNGLIYSPGYNCFAKARCPQVVTVHDLIHLETPWPSRAKYLAYYDGVLRPNIRRNGHVITVSEASASAIRTWLRDDSVEVINCGNGVSEDFTPVGDAYEAAHGDNGPYIVYVGNLRAHKNFDVLLEVLSDARLSDARLVAVLHERDEALARAEHHGVRDRVEVLRSLSDPELAAVYRGAALMAFPSVLEGFGLPAAECLSCGTPVVYSTCCASVAEIVGERGIGVADASDASEWADAISSMLAAPVAVDAGEVSSRYRWDDVAKCVGGVLRSMCGVS